MDGRNENSSVVGTREKCTTYQTVFFGKVEDIKFFTAPAWI